MKFTYGAYNYATAGDSDGEYNTSANGYTYNDVESLLKTQDGQGRDPAGQPPRVRRTRPRPTTSTPSTRR